MKWCIRDRRLQVPGPGEGGEAAVVGALGLGREAAAGQVPALEVGSDTFAADASLATTGVGTATMGEVLLFLAVHF